MPPKILLVEDNPITRKLVRFTLENQDIEVVDAADGASALQELAQQSIALVLQDLVLPDVDGFDLVQRLRAVPSGADIPILALSGLLSKLEEARVCAVGFDDVISKPVEPSRLLQIVRAYLPAVRQVPLPQTFGKGRKMIVADDDPVQRRLVSFRMSKLGFDVTPVADGAEALEQARTVGPDVIVSDVLMPNMDGFGLCINLRRDPRLAKIPVILTTNSYVEPPDRELARKAGANDLVLRTPELSEIIETLRASMISGTPPAPPVAPAADVESERVRRVMRQLERQVKLSAGATQRCALLSAELAVLSGITEALASNDDSEGALLHALAACLDAGAISFGALYLVGDAEMRVLSFGAGRESSNDDLRNFFGHRELLDKVIRTQSAVVMGAEGTTSTQYEQFLAQAKSASALVVPLIHKGLAAGALLLTSKTRELDSDDRIVFAHAVAGQIAQALALTRAFAQQRAAERIANERAAVLRTILDSIADAVVVSDQQGRFTHWNPSADRIMGMGAVSGGAQQWPGAFGIFLPDQVTPAPAERLPLVRAMRGESVDFEEVFLRHTAASDGRWLSVNARPWTDEQGAIQGGVAVFRDITQEKVAQTQLLVSDRMASVGMLAAGVAHEINNPLAAVLANLELAQQELTMRANVLGDARELHEMIEDARDAADRVRLIVKDLKIFSRHEETKTGEVDVCRVLESSLRMTWNEVRHRARLVKEYAANPAMVTGIESRLGQVFINLIVNAAHAIPPGNAERNTIRVVTRTGTDGQVVVEVSDTGEGIPAHVLPRLFTPFFTTKPVGVGTGLGLAICHRIITGFDGRIGVESEVGKGTTFRVILPPARAPLASADSLANRVAPSVRRGRVLVLDDDKAVGSVIRRALGSEHDVVVMTDAREGLGRLRKGEPFDVILCDLMMPQMTGMDLYEEVRKLDPATSARIIFLTGGAFTPSARTFLDEVPNQRIEKPFDTQHLRALVGDRIR